VSQAPHGAPQETDPELSPGEVPVDEFDGVDAGAQAGETPPAPGGLDGAEGGEPSDDAAVADDLRAEDDLLEEMRGSITELTGDLQRLQAEYLNYKRRVDRDREVVLQNAKVNVLSALLPVLDDIDRAREHEELTGGFKAVAEGLERVVSGAGLVRFGAPGDEFDPRLHEALSHGYADPADDVTTTSCQYVVQAGYQFGERVVRPAKVVVVEPAPVGEAGDDEA
jgi:molecular chaperone GrpE